MQKNWWQEAIIYQVYPKSFKDTNGDGIGDIKGITSSLDYIKSIGVNTIWINPIFVSPQIDNGYDISNFYAIDDIFGNVDDVEMLIEEAHKREIKIIFDLVLNHTSSKHPWFQEALKGKDNIYRDYYIWEDAGINGEEPNNWASFFGGSVWEKDKLSHQYYFHLFDKEMPDLNWENLEVQKAMLDIAKYWISKGIDGFRLDAFIHIAKADFNQQKETNNCEPVIAEEYYANLPKVKHYLSHFVREIKKIKPDVFILGEAASATPIIGKDYISENLCSTIISFDHFRETSHSEKESHLPTSLDFISFKESIYKWQNELSDEQKPTLYWNNHDMPRVLSRFGNTSFYRNESAKSFATVMYLLKGIPIIYYGEEIGMKNLDIPTIDFFEDKKIVEEYQFLITQGYKPKEVLRSLAEKHKEVSRGCMQWDSTEYADFSSVSPWNSVNQEDGFNVSEQEKDDHSILNFYRQLLELKKTPLFQEGHVNFLDTPPEIIAYKRFYKSEEAIVIANLSDKQINDIDIVIPSTSKILLGSLENAKQIASYEFVVYKT